MSDRISIAHCRDAAKGSPTALWDNAVVLALVEAVEAAQMVFDDNDRPEASTRDRLERLYAALARFDFGDGQ